MAISLFASFRTYVLFSLLLTTAILSHAFYSKRFFYRSVVHLAKSKFAILAVGNMALVSVLLVWRVVQAIFLGPLRFRERERLHIRARDAVIESCFAMSVFRDEFNLVFVALVTTLLLVKSLHWLSKDRIEFLEEQPLSPRRAHVRLVCLMGFLFCIDMLFVTRSITATFKSNGTMYALFTFEYSILIVELLSDFVRYIFLVIDLSMDGRWEGKSLYSFYTELLSDLCQLAVYIIFFIYVKVYYSFPYHIIREMYMTFHKFRRRFFDFMRYRRVLATMNDLFADATEEQLATGDRTCIICREEMTSAKVLACGHMFHARCLQSWLKRQLTCPTCRANIDVNAPARNNRAADGRNDNGPNANENANADGNENANGDRDANANNNVNGNINQNANAPGADLAAAIGNGGPGNNGGDDAGARLVNFANQWWQGLMDDAGAAGAPGAAAGRPPAFGHPRPAQRAVGPNAVAHMHLRHRRRMAWGHLPRAAVPGQPAGNGPDAGQNLGFQAFHGPHGAPFLPPLVYPLQRANPPNGAPAAHAGPAGAANEPAAAPENGPTGTGAGPASGTGGNENNGVSNGSPNSQTSGNVNTNVHANGSSVNDHPNRNQGTSSSAGNNDAGVNGNTSANTRSAPSAYQNYPYTSSMYGGFVPPWAPGLPNALLVPDERTVRGESLPIDPQFLSRLLNIQEQIEVLKAEVEMLVLTATNSDADENNSNSTEADRAVNPANDGPEVEVGDIAAATMDGGNSETGDGQENVTDESQAGAAENGEEDEAARIRRCRMDFLERRARG